MNRTRSNHESHKVATWVAQSRNIANLGRAKSQHESRKVATWAAQSLSNGIVVGFLACISVIHMQIAKSSSIYVFLMCS